MSRSDYLARERTFFMIKPDGVQRSLVGNVIKRVEEKGYKVCALKMMRLDKGTASRHYGEHVGKSFFNDLVSFITSGPVVAMIVEGDNVIEGMRKMMGKTDPRESPPGTIRGDLAIDLSRNIVHGSDSKDSAYREISIFFNEDEIMDMEKIDEVWLYP
jgi:nucleoside-diphosphate kinase